jgi:hypothetical protein
MCLFYFLVAQVLFIHKIFIFNLIIYLIFLRASTLRLIFFFMYFNQKIIISIKKKVTIDNTKLKGEGQSPRFLTHSSRPST